MSMNEHGLTKKQIADKIFKQLNPHFSALLGSNIGYGVETSSASMTQSFNNALIQWFEHDNVDELVGFLRTAQVTNVISEKEMNTFLDEIEEAS